MVARNAQLISLAAAVALFSPSGRCGIYSGAVTAGAYDQLRTDLQERSTALSNKVAEARQAGIVTDYASVSLVTIGLFRELYVPWDRANPNEIDAMYQAKPWIGANDPVYAALGADGLPFDELADCIEVADAAIAELDLQLAGTLFLQPPPDFSSGQVVLDGSHYEQYGKVVFPHYFFWHPFQEEVMQAFGRSGEGYYSVMDMGSSNTINYTKRDNFIALMTDQDAANRAPIQFFLGHKVYGTNSWHKIEHPDAFNVGRRLFTDYDIDYPWVTNWLDFLFLEEVAPAVRFCRKQSRVHMLSNEPVFSIRAGGVDAERGVSAFTCGKFGTWLEGKYTTISNLNAVYAASHPGFLDAATSYYAPGIGVDTNLQGGPVWYDWCRFNMDRVNEWFAYLHNRAKAVDPEGRTHIKLMGERSMHAEFHDEGLDFEAIARLVDIPGADNQTNPARGEYDERLHARDWRDRYHMEWVKQSIMLDFVKSIAPDKPFYDSEWHGFSASRWRDFHMEPAYVRCALWMAMTHGVSAINAWVWNRRDDGSIDPRADFIGTTLTQPLQLDAWGRTMKEINAHADAFASLVPARRYYMVYYSQDAAIQDRTYTGEMESVYEALKLLNIPVGFATSSELENLDVESQTLVVSPTGFMSDDDLAGLQAFAAAGGKIVLVGAAASFLKDELGFDRSGGSGLSTYAAIDLGGVEAMADALATALAARRPEMPVEILVADTNGTPRYGVLASQYEACASGNQTISLINLGKDARRVELKLYGAHPAGITNMVTGQAFPNSFTMEPQEALLLHLAYGGSNNRLWNSFVSAYGLDGSKGGNQDGDGRCDWDEYVFGGDPTNASAAGAAPLLDPGSGDLRFDIRNDPVLRAHVLATSDLSDGAWTTNESFVAPSGDGTMMATNSLVGTGPAQLFAKLLVEEGNRPPAFFADPFGKPRANAGVAYGGSLDCDAADPEFDPLAFSKLAGPDWLDLASSGELGGIPSETDVGLNVFTVQVATATGSDTATMTILVDPPPAEELANDDFEGGDLGRWLDAGADSRWLANPSWSIGTACAHIRGGSASSNITLAHPLDLAARTRLAVEFSYICNGMETGEDFWLQFSGDNGTSWTTVATYVADTDFTNGARRYPRVVLDSTSHAFTGNALVRFVCDASDTSDNVYLDNILLLAE